MEAQLTFFQVYVMILEFHRGREFQVIPIQSTSAVAMDLNVNTTKRKTRQKHNISVFSLLGSRCLENVTVMKQQR